MHSLLKGTVVIAALVAAAPAFAQWGGPAYGYDRGYDQGYGPAYGPGYGPDYGPDSGYDSGYGPGPGYPQGSASPVYEGRSVATEPSESSGGGVAYCENRYRSYDPSTGTYMGYDGMRHACP